MYYKSTLSDKIFHTNPDFLKKKASKASQIFFDFLNLYAILGTCTCKVMEKKKKNLMPTDLEGKTDFFFFAPHGGHLLN